MKGTISSAIVKTTLAIVVSAGAALLNQSSAWCADCTGENSSGVKKAFEVFGQQCEKQLGDPARELAKCFVPNVYNKLLPIMKALGKDNRFGPGDRVFLNGEKLNGTVAAGSTRIWRTAAPLSKNQLSIRAAKLSPNGGLQFKVCAIGENGSANRVGTINFEDSGPAGEQTAMISGVQGKIVQIEILAIGSAANKIQYSLIAN